MRLRSCGKTRVVENLSHSVNWLTPEPTIVLVADEIGLILSAEEARALGNLLIRHSDDVILTERKVFKVGVGQIYEAKYRKGLVKIRVERVVEMRVFGVDADTGRQIILNNYNQIIKEVPDVSNQNDV